MTAARVGAAVAYNTYRGALAPDDTMTNSTWDAYDQRLLRYAQYTMYYNNTVYTSLNKYLARLREESGLYKHVRGVYNPVARYVELYVAKVYGGALDMDTLEGGAIPLVYDNPSLQPALRTLWRDSNWQRKKSLYVRYGAKLGDTAIKIVDDRSSGRVRMEVLHPGKIKSAALDEVGNVKEVVIEYTRNDDIDALHSRNYTYTEVITQERFSTYRDGDLYPFYTDANGEPVAEWDNEYGFVPVVIASAMDSGFAWGQTGFTNALPKVDEINDAASVTNDSVRKIVNPLWYFSGVEKKDSLDASAASRDAIPAIYGPPESQPFAMVQSINIADATNNIQQMLLELERDMPELAISRLRESSTQLTAPGVRAGYSDAIGRIQEVRGNLDGPLIAAQQMALSIGGYNRYRDYEGFTLDSYERGDTAHYIQQRPVIEDTLSKQERVQSLIQAGASIGLIMAELDYTQDEIDAETNQQREREAGQIAGTMEGLVRNMFTEDSDDGAEADDNETPIGESDEAA